MTADKIWETSLVVLGGVLTGIIGLITGWLLNKWQRESERISGIENRKRVFLAFMAQLKAEAIGTHPAHWWGFYHAKIPNVRHEAELILGDFPNDRQAEFEALTATACDLTWDEINNKKAIMEQLGKMTLFVKERL